MQFKNSKYFSRLKHNQLETPYGHFYFCDKFIIAEINEGCHIDWKHLEAFIHEVFNFYGKNPKIGYISNRINNYSIDPQNWVKAQNQYSFLLTSAIVTYKKSSYNVAALEKHFSKLKINRCNSLEEAIHWMENLDVFKD